MSHGRRANQIPQTPERLLLLLAGLIVLLSGILAYNSWSAYRRTSAQAMATREVVERTVALLSSIKDAETGQRGFLLTGEERYLMPYRQALTEMSFDLDTLASAETARGKAGHLQRIERLRPLVKDELDELARTIDLRRSQGLDAALAIARTDRGQAIMEQIRAICAEIRASSYDAFNQESARARTSANETGLIAILGSAAIFAFLVFATVSIEKGTRRRRELIEAIQFSEDRMRQARDWLQTTLASIGDAVITTDAAGKITLLNPVAQALMGWTNEEAAGKPVEQVFVIRNEETGREVQNPVSKVLREGRTVGLANLPSSLQKTAGIFPSTTAPPPFATATARSQASSWFSGTSPPSAGQRRAPACWPP